MNNHNSLDSNWIFDFFGWLSKTRNDASASENARKRIIAFFDVYLKERVPL